MSTRSTPTIRELRARFVGNALNRVAEMDLLLQAGLQGGEARAELQRHFHALAGLGGTYGLPEVSRLGREGELTLLETGETDPLPLATLRELVAAISAALGKQQVDSAAAERADSGVRSAAVDVLLVTSDPDLELILRAATEIQEISWQRTSSAVDALEQIRERTPAGVITEIRLEDGSGYEIVEALRATAHGDHAMAIMVSGASDFLDKVEAMRCGADAFFERPLDAAVLARRVRQLLETHSEDARFRILAVEDDADQEEFYRATLESAGYDVMVCPEPGELESHLSTWRPDLVLLDIHLPGVSGYDLSRWMRQHEAWATLPIIFITTDSPVTSRIESMRAGGDDHLTKPVTPALLLSAVAARIERARFIRSLLERDGLTGLLTHSAFMERLKAKVAQSRRSALMSSALAMIDLDFFKKVNDQHGHLTGDRVLVSLAALLKRRLRQSDTIGRYGGEEFAILIDDLNGSEALRLIERLREEFSSIEQEGPEGDRFTVSFSAGIALLDAETHTLEDWIDAADRALYRAKEAGRNRVTLA